MSAQSLSTVEQTIFDEMVKKEYQSKGFLLRDKMRTRSNVEGNLVEFRKMGSVTAEQFAFQSQVDYQDPNFAPVSTRLLPYRAATVIDDLQQFLYNFDVRSEEAAIIAMALGRRSDQIGINALAASGTANTIATDGTGLTFAKIRAIVKFFNKNAVPMEDRYITISADAQEQLMASVQFTNSQYTNLNSVTDGTLDQKNAMGLNWTVMPEMTEGGLPLSGNIRSCFAWNKSAMGVATGREFSTIIERVPNLDSWQILGKMFASAVTVDNVGVVQFDIDESVSVDSAITVTTLP